MDVRQLIIVALQVSIIGTVFGFGLNATPADFRYLFERPGLLLRSLLAVLVVTPLAAIVLVRVFEFQPAAEIALLALAISPVPPLLPNRESQAGGHASFGLALMAVLAMLAIATVPLSAQMLEHVLGRPLRVSTAAIARILLVAAVIPLLAGMATRAMLPAAAARMEPVVRFATRVLFFLAVVMLVAGMWRAVWNAIGGGAIVAMVAFVLLALVIGDLLGRPDRDHAVVLALSSACRHPAIALSIASASFPNERFAGTIFLYLIVNVVVGMAYMKWRSAVDAPLGTRRSVRA
jgi:BASS family bile acid:Na+ symporter